ncbi:hypothetical protein [Mycoplasmopsis primatum]|uniref:hypothetical protein n=1 Tax=Mycoplasmopsis primatum TaxID=55604 RepID=UPI00068AB838|nr:hypothetical protein [Mycoplasmopsis primatum]
MNSNSNKILYSVFNKIYNNGKLTKLITIKKNIKMLENFYKSNFQLYEDYGSFYNDLNQNLKDCLSLSPAASLEFEKQFKKSQALQPSILNECYILQTIANLLNLNKFVDADEKEDSIPKKLLSTIMKAKNGELESQMPRYIYYSDNLDSALLQYGDSASIDSIYIHKGFRIRMEIKDTKAKMGEYDLNYGEDGKLIATEIIKKQISTFVKYIDEFNSQWTIFDHAGRNYKLKIDITSAQKILESTYKTNKIDLYLLQSSNNSSLFALPSNQLLDHINFSGSEIRPAGRNNYDVFTPKNLYEVLNQQNAIINNNNVKILYDEKNIVKGRGMATNTRYNINSIYFLKQKDIKIVNGYVEFDLQKVRQRKPTIAMHVYTTLNLENLSTINNKLKELSLDLSKKVKTKT